MLTDLQSNSLAGAALQPVRANRAEVRNPVLALPCAQRVAAMPPEAREWLILFLQDLRDDARRRANESWRKHKAPLALYWKVVATWCTHLVKVLRAGRA